ncbi:MAG: tetratricopeptide repeat protein [Acidobacteriia bacterium]|nr:tetratricopeptide repeat protein [Terriglobia bacterium]
MLRYVALTALLCGALRAQTVLALPFFNQSKTPGLDWIGESISEAVNDSLNSEGVLMLGREDRIEVYRRLSLRPGAELTHASIIKIGQALDASSVLFGYYEVLPPETDKDQSKGSVRITARLIDLKHMHEGPEFSELGALEDLTSLEVHLSWQALDAVEPKTKRTEEEFVRARPRVRLDAIESYTRGLLAQDPAQQHRLFTQAARLDEHYSPPRFQLGKASWAAKDYQVAAAWLTKVEPSDSHYFEAQFLLGLCRYYSGDFAGAEQAFQLVAGYFPLNEVYNDLGAAESRRNNIPAAIANFKKALEGDNADPDYHFNLGYANWRAGNFADAAASFRDALDRNPTDTEATTLLGRTLKQDGLRPGEIRFEARERIKTNYEETTYRQLKAELQAKK